MSCLICPVDYPPHPGTLVCSRDFYALARMLDPTHVGDRERPEFDPPSIPVLHALLDPTKKRPADAGGGRPPGFASSVPIDVHAVSLADPRSQANGRAWLDRANRWWWEQGPDQAPLSAWAVLDGWAGLLVDDHGMRPLPVGRTVGWLGEFLHTHLARVAAQGWVDEFAREVRRCSDQLRTANQQITGERRPKPVGTCRTVVDRDEDGAPIECGGPLFPRWSDDGDTVRIIVCGGECQARLRRDDGWPAPAAMGLAS